MEQLEYKQTLPGHALQKMVVEKKLTAALKKRCGQKLMPVACRMAHYAFTPDGNTHHHVVLDLDKGKGNVSAWMKSYPLPWKFGAFSDEAHEAAG